MSYSVYEAWLGGNEEEKVERKVQKLELEQAKSEAMQELKPKVKAEVARKIEEERERAEKEFMEQLSEKKAEARQKALAQFHEQMQMMKAQFLAKLSRQEKQILKQTPMNLRRVVKQQLQLRRAKAIEQFELQARKAEELFKVELEKKLERWEKGRIFEFKMQQEQWIKSIYKNLDVTYEEVEKQLEASLEKAIASVPKGAEIKEVKFEEGAWKITYTSKIEQTPKQPSVTPESDEFLKKLMPTLPPLIGGKLVFEASKGSKEAASILKSFEERQVVRAKAILSGFTPFYPSPTSVAIESAITWSTEPFQEFVFDPEYAILSASSEILGFITFGKALSWAGGKIGGWIKQTETYQKLARTIKFSRVYKLYYEKLKVPAKAFYQTRIKLPAEKFLYEKSPWLYRRIFGRHAYYGLQVQLEWIDYEKPVAKGTAGLLEKAFGMPYFRSESLYRPMPTKDWARVLYKEWLAPRLKIERQLTWELSLYPAFPVTTKGLELQKQMYPGGLLPSSEKIMQAERVKLPSGKTIYWTPRASLEFEQSVRGLMPNRLFIPKPPSGGEWFRVMRGKPTTPMSRTLERALFGKLSMGGLSGELILTRPNILYQPPSPQTFYKGITKQFKTEPEIKLPTLPKIIKKTASSFKTEKLLVPLISAIPSTSMETKTEIEIKPESITAQIQKTLIKTKTKIAQLTSTIQAPTLSMKSQLVTIETKEIEKAIEIPKAPSLPKSELKLPKPKKRKRKKPVGFYGWIGLEVPVPSAKQILKFVLGGRKK